MAEDDEEQFDPKRGLGESIRRAAAAVFSGDERIPDARGAISSILQHGEHGRKELVRLISGEVAEFMRGIDMAGVLRKAMTGMKVEVKASVRFTSDETIETEVTSGVHGGAERTAEAEDSLEPEPDEQIEDGP